MNASSGDTMPSPAPGAGPPNPGRWELPHRLSKDGVPASERAATIAAYRTYIERQVDSFLGYQANQHADYSAQLSWMLDRSVNNLGDPFIDGNFTVNSKAFERDVLDYFARLWRARGRDHPDPGEAYWGYVLSMGSTEANLYGLWNARDYLKGRALVSDPANPERLLWMSAVAATRVGGAAADSSGPDDTTQFSPVAFYSADTHYSLTKAARVLGIPTFAEVGTSEYPDQCPLGGAWPDEVPSVDGDAGPGSIDVEKLCTLVEFFAARGHPALITLNLGTTFKGAYDPVGEIAPKVADIMRRHGMYERILQVPDGTARPKTVKRHGFWIHVDGALGAAYLPYLRMARHAGGARVAGLPPVPEFDFSVADVFSIAVSGHKWIGAPWPCGIYMTKTKYQLKPPDMPAYVGSPDTTFAGSRDGFSAVLLWEHLARYTQDEQIDRALTAQEIAAYAVDKLTALGTTLGRNLYVGRTPLALTVRFLKPVDALVFKYSLSTETDISDQSIDYAHLFVMPGVTMDLIDRLIADLAKAGAFPEPPPITDRAAAVVTVTPTVATPLAGAAVPLTGRGFE
jgi:histidine decarboxylase